MEKNNKLIKYLCNYRIGFTNLDDAINHIYNLFLDNKITLEEIKKLLKSPNLNDLRWGIDYGKGKDLYKVLNIVIAKNEEYFNRAKKILEFVKSEDIKKRGFVTKLKEKVGANLEKAELFIFMQNNPSNQFSAEEMQLINKLILRVKYTKEFFIINLFLNNKNKSCEELENYFYTYNIQSLDHYEYVLKEFLNANMFTQHEIELFSKLYKESYEQVFKNSNNHLKKAFEIIDIFLSNTDINSSEEEIKKIYKILKSVFTEDDLIQKKFEIYLKNLLNNKVINEEKYNKINEFYNNYLHLGFPEKPLKYKNIPNYIYIKIPIVKQILEDFAAFNDDSLESLLTKHNILSRNFKDIVSYLRHAEPELYQKYIKHLEYIQRKNELKLDIVFKIIADFTLFDDNSLEKLLNEYNVSWSEYNDIAQYIKYINPELYQKYIKHEEYKVNQQKEQFEKSRSERFAIIVSNIKKIVYQIINGIELENGEKKEFDLLDYYRITKLNFEELEHILKRFHLNPDEYRNIKTFIAKNRKDNKLSPTDLQKIYNMKQVIGVEFDKKGNIIPGSGREVTAEEKQNIVKYLNYNHIPVTNRTYNLALRQYLVGTLVLGFEEPSLSSNSDGATSRK